MLSPYLVENRHVAVKRCKHGLFMYNRNDTFVGRGLDLYGEWCEFEIQLLRLFIELGDIVVDAGANIGTHTIAFANLVGPGGLVHAFEPQRRNFLMLAGNIALNGLENVICHQKAVGEADGEISLPPLPPPEVTFNYSAVPLMQGWATGESVPLIALDSLNLPKCRLIKIDTEGMEQQVLGGAKSLIERCRPLLYVENNEPGASKRLNQILNEIGYAAWWSIYPYFDARNFYSNMENIWPNIMPSANMLCAPRELNLNPPDLEPFLGEADEWRDCARRITSRG